MPFPADVPAVCRSIITEPEHPPTSELAPITAARFWIALVPAMTVPFFASLLYFVVLSEQPIGKTIYAGAKVFTIVWPVLCIAILWRRGRGRFKGFKDRRHWGSLRTHLRALPLGIVAWMVIDGLGIVVLTIVTFRSSLLTPMKVFTRRRKVNVLPLLSSFSPRTMVGTLPAAASAALTS